MTPRCPSCGSERKAGSHYCDVCGRRLDGSPDGTGHRGGTRFAWGVAAGMAPLALAAVIAWQTEGWWHDPPVSSESLAAGMNEAIASGRGPGQDPVCVANGLAYDRSDVSVLPTNAQTVSWMNTLVRAGLYASPEPGQSGGNFPQEILVYRPLPALAQWGGSRRLCIARGVRLAAVTGVGEVARVRLRGQPYKGVSANVEWVLEGAAPWLGEAEVGEAMARELPSWRGARWTVRGTDWTLVQRKNFLFVDPGWLPSDSLDQRSALPGTDLATAPPRHLPL
ncbi:MAG: zinc ribbon domain-containing protein [Comamonadaceae bacterium]|nr:MAG: zinc ribbon domain-containing protein [Comamonadaceae bacterium]